MSEKQQHRTRYNLKLEYIAKFIKWLEEEPPMIFFWRWHKWKKNHPAWHDIEKVRINALFGVESIERNKQIRNDILTEYVTKLEQRLIKSGIYPAFVKWIMYKILQEMTEEDHEPKS